ncbi:3-methyl-2-oxobutanoate hydroxymethyltransferase [Kribbella solani]|uniref:3-methyl-2-oxobutanoate hydroxymethyltransferase n=1 Tax=Kribbella solani TaxID=236067 RepID=UPI0029A8B438|nr:3-methyl-2-oxobutanoate hydroxymethyltransferase [Kribbella solani]MDX3003358.1 3-methyl-2-oxobutanoate hydroxymethyltransferase [Kribbella solani]
MVDNFLSAGTQGDDEELPSPYGTGPKNRATEEHRRSDHDGDTWRDRGSDLGLDPSPSLPNAPRMYERGPVPQQPYVPKPPFLPSAPPPPQQQQPRAPEQPEYYGDPGQQGYSEQNPFRSSPSAPGQPPQGRPSPFGPGSSGSNGVPGGRAGGPPSQHNPPPSNQPSRPPAPPQSSAQSQSHSSNGLSHRPPQPSNGNSNWSSPAPQPSTPPPPAQPPASQPPSSHSPSSHSPAQPPSQSNGLPPGSGSNGSAYGSSNGLAYGSSNGLSNGLPPGSGSNGLSNGLAPQQPNPHPSTPSDPSAEYESSAPVAEGDARPRPVGARRRAGVQQDAPSQVPSEQFSSHRAARRAQAAGDAAPGTDGLSAETTHPADAGQAAAAGQSPATGLPADAVQSDGAGQSAGAGLSAGAGQSGGVGQAGDAVKRPRRYRVHHLRDFKNRGEKWAMLTAYDQYTAEIFDQAGIPVLLVGDSAANNVYGHETTLRVTVDELIPLARAVAGAVERALVVADLPFGSYQASPEQALHTAVRFMKEAGVHAVKLEGGRNMVPMVEKLTQSGIPVMAHIGFTPQSEHSIGGYRVQGRGDQAATLIDDAVALAKAGAFSVVLEMVPGDVAAEITKRVPIPTIGIGAGRDTDAQVLVWQDMAGLRSGAMPRFVKQYADLRGILTSAAATYAAEVASGVFPADEHTF